MKRAGSPVAVSFEGSNALLWWSVEAGAPPKEGSGGAGVGEVWADQNPSGSPWDDPPWPRQCWPTFNLHWLCLVVGLVCLFGGLEDRLWPALGRRLGRPGGQPCPPRLPVGIQEEGDG